MANNSEKPAFWTTAFWTTMPGILTGLAALVTAVTTAIALTVRDSDNPPTTTVPSTVTTGGTIGPSEEKYPNDAESMLLSHIPSRVRSGACQRASLSFRLPGATATIRCSFEGNTVQYNQFPDQSSMDAQYFSRVETAPELGGDLSGPCSESSFSGESTYRNDLEQVVGRLLCYQHQGQSWYEWKHNGLRILTYLFRNDLDSNTMFEAWRAAGPV